MLCHRFLESATSCVGATSGVSESPSLGIYVDNPRAAAGWVRSPRWKRSHSPLRAQRESRSSPELPGGRRTHPAVPMPTDHTQQRVPLGTYANNPLITSPAMSVSRKSRPSKRCVKRVCSMPKRCSIVACKSCTFTGFSTMLYPKSSVRP